MSLDHTVRRVDQAIERLPTNRREVAREALVEWLELTATHIDAHAGSTSTDLVHKRPAALVPARQPQPRIWWVRHYQLAMFLVLFGTGSLGILVGWYLER